ncbi:MAG: hypothetical protein WD316_12890 [Phycisphaeraceae bacterium]
MCIFGSACSDQNDSYPPAQFRTEVEAREGLGATSTRTRLHAAEAIRVRGWDRSEAVPVLRTIASSSEADFRDRIYAVTELRLLGEADEDLAIDAIRATIADGPAVSILFALYEAEALYDESYDISRLRADLEGIVHKHRQTGIHPWTDIVPVAEKLIRRLDDSTNSLDP